MSITNKLTSELSQKTGVASEDVEKLLIELGLSSSIQEASTVITENVLENIKVSDLVLGVKVGKVLVHM